MSSTKPYNGFAGKERDDAYWWLMDEYKAGRRVRPVRCDCCGQDQGHIEPHSEDYSAPYGDHVGGFGVCYLCHMMVHCRFKAKPVWDVYREGVRSGKRAAPFPYRAWGTVRGMLWYGKPILYTQHEPLATFPLDLIDSGYFLDRGGPESSEKRHGRYPAVLPDLTPPPAPPKAPGGRPRKPLDDGQKLLF